VVAIVALAVILGVVALAIIISSLGGDEEPPPGTGLESTQAAGVGLAASNATQTPASGDVTPGAVPELVGLQEAEAKQKIAAAGFTVSELRTANSAEQGTVIDQSPASGVEQPRGRQVVIVISEGP
jgi:serine/threonine-protein kinase